MRLHKKWIALLVIVVVGCGYQWRQQSLNTKLLHSIAHHDALGVETSLQDGADPDAEDQNGSGICEACRQGYFSIVTSLLRHKASLSAQHAAFILNRMASVSDNQVVAANREDYRQIIGLLLAHGAKIDQRCELGHTPLTLAARECNLEMCRLFIEHGADVNATLTNGLTALEMTEGTNDGQARRLAAFLRSEGAFRSKSLHGER